MGTVRGAVAGGHRPQVSHGRRGHSGAAAAAGAGRRPDRPGLQAVRAHQPGNLRQLRAALAADRSQAEPADGVGAPEHAAGDRARACTGERDGEQSRRRTCRCMRRSRTRAIAATAWRACRSSKATRHSSAAAATYRSSRQSQPAAGRRPWAACDHELSQPEQRLPGHAARERDAGRARHRTTGRAASRTATSRRSASRRR